MGAFKQLLWAVIGELWLATVMPVRPQLLSKTLE